MKQSKRIISMLLSVVMLLTTLQISAFAAHTSYTSAGGYDVLDDPYVTPAQAASMLLDLVDAKLAADNVTIPVKFDYGIGSYGKTIDLRSIDRATTSIDSFWNWSMVDIAFMILSFGDIEDMNMTWIENCPLRTDGGRTDLDVVLALCRFLKDNYYRIGKIIDDSFNYGFVTSVTDLPDTIHDVPGTLKASVLKLLNEGVEPPAGTTVDSLVQKLFDSLIVGKLNPQTGEYDGLLPGMRGKANISTTSGYTFITDALNAGMDDMIVPVLSKLLLGLAGVEFSPEFPGGDPSGADNLDMIIGLLTELGGGIPYTPEDLLTPLSKMNAALRYLIAGGGDTYFTLDSTGLHMSQDFITLFDNLIRAALTIIPALGFLENTKVFKTEEEVMAMTMPDCYAYLAKLLINEYVAFADIPDSATTVRSVVTYLLVGLAKDVLPETNFDAMIAAGVMNPFTDGVFIVGAALGRYYLNGLLPIDIPAGLNFEQTIGFVFDWFISKYGGLFDTSDLLPSDTVWQKIDKVLFDIIPRNWLSPQITGSKSLVMDWLLGNALNFNYVGLLSIVTRNPSSELNNSITKVLLNTFARLLKGALGNNTILPMNLSSFEAIFTDPNLRATIQSLCLYLSDYGSSLLGTLFPLVTRLMGIWSKETYIRKAPAGSPQVGIAALQNLLDSYTPRNLNADLQYYEAGYNFFGSEDFSQLRDYFNYKQAKTEAQELLDAYAADGTLDLQMNTDVSYRVTFYFNRLQMRSALCVTQLTNQIIKANDLELQQADYTAKSWAAYQTAYNFANQVRNNAIMHVPGIRQSTISAARQNLFKSIKGLADFVPYADYTQLDMYIKEAQNKLATLPAGLYTPDSIQVLRDAIATAQGTDRLLSAEDQAIVDDVAAQLYTALYGLTYILAPAIIALPYEDSQGNPITPIVDTARRFIYGLPVGGIKLGFFEAVFEAVGGAVLTLSPTAQGNGTGTKVRLSYNGTLLLTLTAVLFGDVNGDGNIDDGDSGQIVDYENYLYNWTGSPDKRFAADINGDLSIDSIDAGVVTDCLNYIKTVDQTTGIALTVV